MFKKFILVLLLSVLGCSNINNTKKPVDYVNPFVDSHKSRWFFFSSATRPFGMVNLSPDTQTEGSWNSGYLYDSTRVRCFSHIHAWQLSGVAVMPTTGEFKGHLGMDAYQSSFSHDTEIAKPGYHKIVLDDYNITAELTATQRVGFHKYLFPESDQSYILFDTGAYLAHSPTRKSYVEKISDTEIEGWALMGPTRRRPKATFVYFVAKTNQPMQEFGGWEQGVVVEGETTSIAGPNAGAFMRFNTEKNKPVLLKVAISYTSIDGARNNMNAELDHWDFDLVKSDAINEWNDWLSRIEVKGGTETQKIKLYTDLWHAIQGRRIISDVDGKYCDMTGENPVVKQIPLNSQGIPQHNHYNFDGWWGSHWSLNILWSMIYPEVVDDFCNSMIDMYQNGGLIPRGPSGGNYTYVMIGDPAAPIFASAYNKGIRNWDTEAAYTGLRKNAFPGGIRDRAGYEHGPNPKGGGMIYYVNRGYVPEGLEGEGYHKDGAAMTLEYAYQDWCLGQLAKALGKTEDYDLFTKRAQNYKNLWDPSVNFMRPRNMDGSWLPDFKPVGEGFNTIGFCESNSAIYTHFVPHDVKGLAELFGGVEAYTDSLNAAFERAQGNKFIAKHGQHSISWVDYENQPATGMAHLFNYSGAPWLTQKWVRLIKEQTFGDITPYGGYNGDEDQGQMGALGVLMAIGLFQEDGGASINNWYDITSPIFDEITLHLNNDYFPGSTFTIKTKNNSAENMYIQSATLNGETLNKSWFGHDVFAKGGTLELVMGPEPNKNWASDINSLPPSNGK